MRCQRLILLLLIGALLISGCKKWPTTARPAPSSDLISFVGIGDVNSGPVNILVVFSNLDSTGYQSGSITYRSVTSNFTELNADTSSDTLRFSFSRGGTIFRVRALQIPTGLTLTFTEPASIQPFRLNREIDGYNMTGSWTGDMSSTAMQSQSSAEMTMDQTGTLFLGTVQVSFFEAWSFELNSGSSSNGSFQVLGTVSTSSGSYPAGFSGSYSTPDSIHGTWSAGAQAEIDRGEFLFTRSYQ